VTVLRIKLKNRQLYIKNNYHMIVFVAFTQ